MLVIGEDKYNASGVYVLGETEAEQLLCKMCL